MKKQHQLKPNILEEINKDATAGATHPPVEGLRNAAFVSDSDTMVIEDEVLRLVYAFVIPVVITWPQEL